MTLESLKSQKEQKIKKNYVDPVKFNEMIIKYYETGEFSEELGNMINSISEHVAFMPNFINYCVDSETEALTNNGWKKYNQIQTSESILSYDIEDGYLKWSAIKELFINEKYDGMMHVMAIRGLNALVTPNHRFVTTDRGLDKIEHLKTGDEIVLMGKPLISPPWEYPLFKDKSDSFIKLIGLAVSNGFYKTGIFGNYIEILLPEHKMNGLLKDIEVEYRKYQLSTLNDTMHWKITKRMANMIAHCAPNGVLSMEFISQLSNDQRLLLIKTMVHCAGWSKPYIGNYHNPTPWSYCSSDKSKVDSFLALCTLSGLTTNTFNAETNSREHHIVNINAEPRTVSKFQSVDTDRGPVSAGSISGEEERRNTPTLHYAGTVWCPKTDYGTFVCRRNNTIYITGNTYRDEMVSDSNFKMIKALNQKKYNPSLGNPFAYFTKICFRAFINVIKKEKRGEDTISRYQSEMYDELLLNGLVSSHSNDQGVDYDE